MLVYLGIRSVEGCCNVCNMPVVPGDPRELRGVLGARLAKVRRDAHLTQTQLAEQIGYSRATVAGVESGHQQAAAGFWQRCDVILNAAGELVVAWQELVSARRRTEQDAERRSQALRQARAAKKQHTTLEPHITPGSLTAQSEPGGVTAPVAARSLTSAWPETVAALPELWRLDQGVDDGNQDEIGQAEDDRFDVDGYLSPVVRWLTWSPQVRREGQREATGHRAVSLADVATVQEMTRAFGRLDDLFGGGHARDALTGYLNAEVAPMLRHGRYGEQTGLALLSAVAELVRLAGWMSYDAGRHRLAQRYLVQALRLAMAAGDEALGAEILAGMSHQAVHVDEPVLGLDLARAASATAQRTAIGPLVAEASVMEAHSHARLGDEHSCTEAMARAERAMEGAELENTPVWLGYFGEAYLAAKFAHCLRDVGRPEQAEPYAQRSLDMEGRYLRGRAFNTVLLASIQADQGQVELACELGTQAVDMAAAMHSRRAVEFIADLRSRLRLHDDAPAVREFEQQTRVRLDVRA